MNTNEALIERLDEFCRDYGEREYPAGYMHPDAKTARAQKEAALFGEIRAHLTTQAEVVEPSEIDPDKVALFVIEQKALVHKQLPSASEDYIKDAVMMRLARKVMAAGASSVALTDTQAEVVEPEAVKRARQEMALDKLHRRPSGPDAANIIAAYEAGVQAGLAALRPTSSAEGEG